MSFKKYFGFEEKLNDALIEARGVKINPRDEKIRALERKLETAKLTPAELLELQKELKRLKSA
jgi:hypothetical protein